MIEIVYRTHFKERVIYADTSETLSEVFERTGIRYPIPMCESVLEVDGVPDCDGTLRNMPINRYHSSGTLFVFVRTKLGMFGV